MSEISGGAAASSRSTSARVLAEVLPALVVHRDHRWPVRSPHSSTASAPVSVYRSGPETGNRTPPRCTIAVSTSQPIGHALHAVVEHGVAGDPELAVALSLPGQREAGDLAHDRPAQRRAVAAGRAGHGDRRPSRGCSSVVVSYSPSPTRPTAEATAPAAVVITVSARSSSSRPARPGCRRDGRGSAGPRRSGRSRRPRRRAGQLVRRGAPARIVVAARRVEGGVGQQPPAGDLQQNRGPADVGDRTPVIARARPPTPARRRRSSPSRPRRSSGAGPRTR